MPDWNLDLHPAPTLPQDNPPPILDMLNAWEKEFRKLETVGAGATKLPDSTFVQCGLQPTVMRVYPVLPPKAGPIGPHGGAKIPQYDVLRTYATPFTSVRNPVTHESKELRPAVCRHFLPHVDTACPR